MDLNISTNFLNKSNNNKFIIACFLNNLYILDLNNLNLIC